MNDPFRSAPLTPPKRPRLDKRVIAARCVWWPIRFVVELALFPLWLIDWIGENFNYKRTFFEPLWLRALIRIHEAAERPAWKDGDDV